MRKESACLLNKKFLGLSSISFILVALSDPYGITAMVLSHKEYRKFDFFRKIIHFEEINLLNGSLN